VRGGEANIPEQTISLQLPGSGISALAPA